MSTQEVAAQNYYERKFAALDERIRQLEKHIHYPHNIPEIERTTRENESRIRQLEKHIHYPHRQSILEKAVAEKQAAARAQAFHRDPTIPDVDKVPMRSDVETILTLTTFCKRLISFHDLGHAVTLEVRNEARRALGLKEREV